MGERLYAYADTPYRIADFASIADDPRHTITFERTRYEALLDAGRRLGADGLLVRDADDEVALVTLAEKIVVPLLVKLTNLVPDSGIWLNTQRPEWNDANNALAGWGVSLVTLDAIVRHAGFLLEAFSGEGEVELSAAVRRLLDEVVDVLATTELPLDDEARHVTMSRLGRAGEAHRRAVYTKTLGEAVATPHAAIRSLLASTIRLGRATIRASGRPDGLYGSYDILHIDGQRARVSSLGPMLEGQVAVLDSGLLDEQESIALLRALRESPLYRADQHSYLLYPNRAPVPFLERNRLPGEPPLTEPSLFVVDRHGDWHFQADLSTLADVADRLETIGAEPATRGAVKDMWRTTFNHDEFTGRSDRFFMFEGLGSIYWHMVAKLAVAVQWAFGRAADPVAAATLADIYHDIRDGLGFRKGPGHQGAFPTDPYSHTPQHLGAQQPGMTGQVKEQVIMRFGELGVEVREGCVRFEPRLVPATELLDSPRQVSFTALGGSATTLRLEPGSLAFTYCQVPVVYRTGDVVSVEIEHVGGRVQHVDGTQLDRAQSASLLEREGAYRRLTVTVPSDWLYR